MSSRIPASAQEDRIVDLDMMIRKVDGLQEEDERVLEEEDTKAEEEDLHKARDLIPDQTIQVLHQATQFHLNSTTLESKWSEMDSSIFTECLGVLMLT